MISTNVLKKTLLTIAISTIMAPAIAAGGGNACAVKSATNIRASGLIEEYSLYSSAMEKSAAAVFKYLKDPNYSLGGPLDLANTSRGGAVNSSAPIQRSDTQSTVREVTSDLSRGQIKNQKSSL